MKKTFRLEGLDCANCAAKIERGIAALDGVSNASVNFMTGKLTIEAELMYPQVRQIALLKLPHFRISNNQVDLILYLLLLRFRQLIKCLFKSAGLVTLNP